MLLEFLLIESMVIFPFYFQNCCYVEGIVKPNAGGPQGLKYASCLSPPVYRLEFVPQLPTACFGKCGPACMPACCNDDNPFYCFTNSIPSIAIK